MNTISLVTRTGVMPYTEFGYEDAYANIKAPTSIYIPNYGIENERFLQHFVQESMWAKYLTGCLKTWNDSQNVSQQVSNAAHGIVGELAELCNAKYHETEDNVIDELGDVLYYRTIFCMLFGLDIGLRSSNEINLFNCIAMISDVGKKSAYHGKINAEKTLNKVKEGAFLLDTMIITLINDNNLQIDAILQYNLYKLSQRHNAGKFNPNYT